MESKIVCFKEAVQCQFLVLCPENQRWILYVILKKWDISEGFNQPVSLVILVQLVLNCRVLTPVWSITRYSRVPIVWPNRQQRVEQGIGNVR